MSKLVAVVTSLASSKISGTLPPPTIYIAPSWLDKSGKVSNGHFGMNVNTIDNRNIRGNDNNIAMQCNPSMNVTTYLDIGLGYYIVYLDKLLDQ